MESVRGTVGHPAHMFIRVKEEKKGWATRPEDAYRELKNDPLCKGRMALVSHADDKGCPPLQMGDLMAYQSRIKSLVWLNKDSAETSVFKRLAGSHGVYYIGMMNKAGMEYELNEYLVAV
jgi:hypothetical protein